MDYPLIFITGPTAAGKSRLALALAEKIGAEIISCDSMLFYRQINILNSKPTPLQRQRIRHHMIDIISVEEEYDVFRYQQEVKNIILPRPRKRFIVCGGSGLYLKALLDGIFVGAGKDEKIRQRLRKEAEEKSTEHLYRKLEKIDALSAQKISPSDLRRIIRALEVYYISGRPLSLKKKEAEGLWGKVPMVIYGLLWPRPLLYARIEKRVEDMFEEGAVREVESLAGITLSRTASGLIGIKEIRKFLEKKLSWEEAKEEVKKNTRHLAKKQMTWFRKEKRIRWLKMEDENSYREALEVIISEASSKNGQKTD